MSARKNCAMLSARLAELMAKRVALNQVPKAQNDSSICERNSHQTDQPNLDELLGIDFRADRRPRRRSRR